MRNFSVCAYIQRICQNQCFNRKLRVIVKNIMPRTFHDTSLTISICDTNNSKTIVNKDRTQHKFISLKSLIIIIEFSLGLLIPFSVVKPSSATDTFWPKLFRVQDASVFSDTFSLVDVACDLGLKSLRFVTLRPRCSRYAMIPVLVDLESIPDRQKRAVLFLVTPVKKLSSHDLTSAVASLTRTGIRNSPSLFSTEILFSPGFGNLLMLLNILFKV